MSVTLYRKLLEACQESGCPLCHLEQQAVRRYLDGLFYESVNNPAVRERLRDSRGFCREHAWLVVNERLSDALGIAIVYRDLLGVVLKDLDDWPKWLRREGSPLRPGGGAKKENETLGESCPACEQQSEVTETMLAVLLKHLDDDELNSALQQSDGLCLRHLFLALKSACQEATRARLLEIQRQKIASLQGELDEFIRKNDYRFSGEGFGPEGDSWRRALGLVAGNNPLGKET